MKTFGEEFEVVEEEFEEEVVVVPFSDGGGRW